MKILYKLTTKSRPDKMLSCIHNIRAAAVEKDPWIIVTLDKNDPTLTEAVRLELAKIPNVQPIVGYSKNKIAALNRDIPAGGWDIIVATSDDIRFFEGFDKQIANDAVDFYMQQIGKESSMLIDPANFDVTIWYEDGAVHGKIMTVPIMTKKYYDRLGYIYNPVYESLWADEEAIYVGEKLGKIYYSTAKILEHMHPAWGKGQWDAQYRFTDSFYYREKKIFDKRKAQNFPI